MQRRPSNGQSHIPARWIVFRSEGKLRSGEGGRTGVRQAHLSGAERAAGWCRRSVRLKQEVQAVRSHRAYCGGRWCNVQIADPSAHFFLDALVCAIVILVWESALERERWI